MIVILTGAGISQESGIPTFRDADGLWENEPVEEVATPEGFLRNPEKVLKFYNDRRRNLLNPEIAPNAAHLALARLEAESADKVLLVTQNIDNLHERAGSKNILHMHGELLRVACVHCHKSSGWAGDMGRMDICPNCKKDGFLRPDIVWFGEMPLYMDEIDKALDACRLFAAIGTSGQVYPAAGFVAQARAGGARTVELNVAPSSNSRLFAERRFGPATQTVPQWVEEELARQAGGIL